MVFGRIYTLHSHQTTDIYVGSTIQILCKRMTNHRTDYKRYINKKRHYMTSYEILQYDDAYIELLFEGEFQSDDALRKKEGEYIREMNCVNKRIEGRANKEYYEDNKPKILEYHAQYYKKNHDMVIEKSKIYREEHFDQIHARRQQTYECECGSINCIENKERQESSVQHQTYMNSLTEIKQEIIKVPKFTCECGTLCNINDKKRHERSQKHQKFIQSLSAEGNCVEVHSSEGQVAESSEVLM